MKGKCEGVSHVFYVARIYVPVLLRRAILSIFCAHLISNGFIFSLCSILRTWEPAKNVKEDDPVTFFRYVDKIGLEEQSEEDSKSKLGGKTAWRKILKDGRPPMIEG